MEKCARFITTPEHYFSLRELTLPSNDLKNFLKITKMQYCNAAPNTNKKPCCVSCLYAVTYKYFYQNADLNIFTMQSSNMHATGNSLQALAKESVLPL